MNPRFQQQLVECLSFGLALATVVALLFLIFHIVIWGVVIGAVAFAIQQVRFWLIMRARGRHRQHKRQPVIIEHDDY